MCIQDSLGSIVGSVIPIFGGFNELYEQKALADYQNKQLLEQAKQARENAARERQEGIEEARNRRLQAILNMGDEKVAFATSNISLNSLTAINQTDNLKLNGELDALTTLKNANNRAEAYTRQADSIYSNYALGKYKAKRNFQKGMINEIQNTAMEVGKIVALI